MAQPVIQTSFNSGEWAPSLNARVDIAKYHSGAALLRNFFVDYRGGATTSPGTKYILQCWKSNTAVRLIPFQASFTVSYILEFGNGYIRFFNNGAPVLQTAKAISGINKANPGTMTVAAHGWSNGDWIYVQSVGGMTQVNGNYYMVASATANDFQLTDLNGNNVNTTGFSTYTAGGTASRVYVLASPYAANELAQIKFAQNINVLILCHPNYPPYQLTLISAANWTIGAITFGSTIAAPTGQAVASTLGAGTVNYAYVITAVDSLGQESAPSAYATLAATLDIRTVPGTNTISWTAVTGALSYNVYKAELRYATPVPVGAQFGFIGNCTDVNFIDSNIGQDFSSGPPVVLNPFSGSGVATITITNRGSGYTAVPTVTFAAAPPGGVTATAYAYLQAVSVAISSGGAGYSGGQSITLANGVVLNINATIATVVSSVSIINPGLVTSGSVPSNPVGQIATSGSGAGASFDVTWELNSINLSSAGAGYGGAPAITISGAAGGAATATLGAPAAGNPTVPTFFQQRLVLAGPVGNPQQFNMSQPGAYYNFNVTNPIEPDNAFQGTLVSGQLNTIQALVSQPQGLIALSDRQAWLINGGSPGSGVSAIDTVANAQIFNGAAALPPIVAVDDILYVQSKNSIVRDLVFNFGKQVYTGMDISVMSSHLFYGFQLLEWAWAEEPFKIVKAVRNDGTMLNLTFLKEQELVAWTHRDTQGSFKSVATVTEAVAVGSVDAVYTVVQRAINGSIVQYIEREVEQYYPNGATDAWQVDTGLQYNGASTLTFTGAQHLALAPCVGLATDNLGNVTPFTVTPTAVGGFTLAAPTAPATGYTRVTIGLAFTPQLTTLGIDTGNPTIQGKMKKLPAVTVRVANTLGLSIGTDFDNLVNMDDLIVGNLGKDTNEVVTNLVTGDALQAIDPQWSVPGQYCIQQSLPYPASILGLIPQIAVGDTKDSRS